MCINKDYVCDRSNFVFFSNLVAIKAIGVWVFNKNIVESSLRNLSSLFQHSELVKDDKESNGRLRCLFVFK